MDGGGPCSHRSDKCLRHCSQPYGHMWVATPESVAVLWQCMCCVPEGCLEDVCVGGGGRKCAHANLVSYRIKQSLQNTQENDIHCTIKLFISLH